MLLTECGDLLHEDSAQSTSKVDEFNSDAGNGLKVIQDFALKRPSCFISSPACEILIPRVLLSSSPCDEMDTAAGHANIHTVSVVNHPHHFVAGPSRRRSPHRAGRRGADGDGLPNRKAKSRLRRPSQVDAARLEATYTSRKSHFSIGLPISEEECQKRVQSYSYANIFPKGSHSTQRIQETTSGNGLTTPDIHHIVWVGRKWNAILSLFDSVVESLGKRQTSFKPQGLMFLLKAGYS